MKKKPKKNKSGKNWSAYDEIRHPTPKAGFSFKDRKRSLKEDESKNKIKEYYEEE